MDIPTPPYDRAPSRQFVELLSAGGFLSSLVGLADREIDGYRHDIIFRAHNELHVYRGLCRLLAVRVDFGSEVALNAHASYRAQPCARNFLRRWRTYESGFSRGLDRYVKEIAVSSAFLQAEGAVQDRWSRVNSPWTPFDREAALVGAHRAGRAFAQVELALAELKELARVEDWPVSSTTGTEVDQLAVDFEGKLVLLKLKDASNSSADIYYSPLHLLQCVWEWNDVLDEVRSNLQAAIDARVRLGMTSGALPALRGGLRAAVGFGPDLRSPQVRHRYSLVLDVANRYLPGKVPPIETWALHDSRPVLLA